MDPRERSTHSFVVRVWRERRVGRNGRDGWRGQIVHVQDDTRQSFRRLEEVSLFLAIYLIRLGVYPGHSYWLFRLLAPGFLKRAPRRK
ncbi:hypothetical protein [Candidatus Chloroploca sp. Khr17]|uniref:hypothetical protein n=1 Tax=Candidatus Chloroploca sp. Khr17 TaxID=2496869 RepID=UPI00101C94C5|nr:hypothetical protein [Candidatus Chloroploca sp. Khr17]